MSPKLPADGWRECESCGGVYNVGQRGSYYHKCPPVKAVAPDVPVLDPEGNPIMDLVPIKDPRDENLDLSDPEKPKVKAEGKGSSMIDAPGESEEVEPE